MLVPVRISVADRWYHVLNPLAADRTSVFHHEEECDAFLRLIADARYR
ncbi:MAG: hypothetical protein V3W34_06090 [Phycisphaerae bacterium]